MAASAPISSLTGQRSLVGQSGPSTQEAERVAPPPQQKLAVKTSLVTLKFLAKRPAILLSMKDDCSAADIIHAAHEKDLQDIPEDRIFLAIYGKPYDINSKEPLQKQGIFAHRTIVTIIIKEA